MTHKSGSILGGCLFSKNRASKPIFKISRGLRFIGPEMGDRCGWEEEGEDKTSLTTKSAGVGVQHRDEGIKERERS